ncbi:MAG: transcriptional regulator NrdR, partial [Solirubrobacteraceae bacterium]
MRPPPARPVPAAPASCPLRCPYCQSHDLRVVDSRDSETGEAIRRRRACNACEKRFTTYE